MKRIQDLTVEEMRHALRDLQAFCYIEGDREQGTWSSTRPDDLGNVDICNVALDVLNYLGLKPSKEFDGKSVSVVECGNCFWRGECNDAKPLIEVDDLQQRLDPGSIVPFGECPKCKAFVYLFENVEVEKKGGEPCKTT